MHNPGQNDDQGSGLDGAASGAVDGGVAAIEAGEGADDAPPEPANGVRIGEVWEVVEVDGRQYLFDHQLEVGGAWYVALEPVVPDEADDGVTHFIFLFKEAIGEGAEDEYLGVPAECEDAVNAAFRDHYSTMYINDVAYRLLAEAEIDGVAYLALQLKEGSDGGLFFAIDNDGEDLVLLTGEEDNYGEVVTIFREAFGAELAAAGAEEFLDHGGGMGGHEDPQ